jgi:hypothetical protein
MVQQGHAQDAVRLLGAVAMLRRAMGIPVRPADQPALQRALAAARTALGQAAYAGAWTAGQAGPLEQVIAATLAAPAPLLLPAPQSTPPAPMAVPPRRDDWGDAPEVAAIYGREDELAALARWVGEERCRLVALLGMSGIGKTALAARLAQDLASQFAAVFWRSLRNALPFEEWLGAAIRFLSGQQQTTLPESLDGRLALLLALLRAQHCLLVLDNCETVLASGALDSGYREGYGALLRTLGEASHQSLLLLTSREQPPELAMLAGEQAAVRSLRLSGLDEGASQALLQDRRLTGGSASWGCWSPATRATRWPCGWLALPSPRCSGVISPPSWPRVLLSLGPLAGCWRSR